MFSVSPINLISSELGFGFFMKAFSRAMRTLLSIEVRFFLRFPIKSMQACVLVRLTGVVPFTWASASSNHFSSRGFSLHMFLNDKLRASNREIVVCEKSLPYILPMARPTSPWVYPCLILRCLNSLANCSNSSRSTFSSAGRSSLGTTVWMGELIWGANLGNCISGDVDIDKGLEHSGGEREDRGAGGDGGMGVSADRARGTRLLAWCCCFCFCCLRRSLALGGSGCPQTWLFVACCWASSCCLWSRFIWDVAWATAFWTCDWRKAAVLACVTTGWARRCCCCCSNKNDWSCCWRFCCCCWRASCRVWSSEDPKTPEFDSGVSTRGGGGGGSGGVLGLLMKVEVGLVTVCVAAVAATNWLCHSEVCWAPSAWS